MRVLKLFKFFFLIFFIFISLLSIPFLFAETLSPFTNLYVHNYTYDRYNYSYIKFIHFYYFDYYSLNFDNFLNIQFLKYNLSKNYFNFYTYKYCFMIEDSLFNKNLEIFNFFYSLGNKKIGNILENYNYSLDIVYLDNYYKMFFFSKFKGTSMHPSLNFLIVEPSSIFGDLFTYFNLKTSFNFYYFYFLIFGYSFFLFFFFLLCFFLFIYYVFFYLFFYKKFYIIGQFFTMYSLDTEDNHGGYLDYMEEQEADLSFSDTYYNIIKYEFNYLNYILFLNKYLLIWLLISKPFYSLNIDLGQFKNLRFSFFNEIFCKIEINFLAGLTQEDDFGEWAYFPYEHIVEAFPESNFYVGDAVFEYAKNDLAFDFSLVRRLVYKDFLHPLNLFYEDGDDELEYEEFFDDIEGFLKNYNYSFKIINTYKIRFKNVYKRLLKSNNLIENSLTYAGSVNSFKEIHNRILPVNFEGFFMDWPYFREIINNYNILNNNYEESTEEESFQESNLRDRERERVLKREEEDLQVVEKHKLFFVNLGKSEEETLSTNFIDQNSFKESLTYLTYNKIKKDIWRAYSTSNFFSIILESSFLHWVFRSNWLWSKFKISLEYTFLIEDAAFLQTDVRLNNFFNSFYKMTNFGEDLFFKNLNNLIITNQLVNYYSSLEQFNLKFPPYKNYIGFLLFNPAIRRNRDLYMLDFYYSNILKNLIYKETSNFGSFNFLTSNTYIFDVFGLPSGMVLSTNNVIEDSLYTNSYMKEIDQAEVVEEEDVDFSMVKPLINSITRFVSFNFLFPLSLFSFYTFLIFKNLIF